LPGGTGAYVTGLLRVSSGQTLTVIVGRGGVSCGFEYDSICGDGTPDLYGGGGKAYQGGSGGGRNAIAFNGDDLVTAGGGGGSGFGGGSGSAGGVASIDPAGSYNGGNCLKTVLYQTCKDLLTGGGANLTHGGFGGNRGYAGNSYGLKYKGDVSYSGGAGGGGYYGGRNS
jgi:hypothetical protein